MTRIFGFEQQPYRRELELEILRVEEDAGVWTAILADSLLYPAGGGQPSDQGWLNGVKVENVERSEEGLRHELSGAVEPGTASLVLDWVRRYDHMQQHTAQHILTRLALDRLGWATRSFHIGPEVSDIELDCSPPEPAEIEALEDAVAEIIGAARAIRCFRVSQQEFEQMEVRSRGLPAGHQGDIRLVEIEDLDVNTCGGTHLRATSEVESLKIVGSEPLRGGCRLFWVAGKRVRRRLASHEDRAARLRRLLDTGDEAVVEGLTARLEQLQETRRARKWLERRRAETLAREIAAETGVLVDRHLEGFEAPLLRPVTEELAKMDLEKVVLVTAEDASGIGFALVSDADSLADLPGVGKALAEVLDGRGGGTGKVFQGKAESLARRVDAVDVVRRALS